VLAAALPDCEAAGVVCHRRHSNGNRDGPQLPNGRSDESEGDQDNVAQLEGAVANGTAEGSSAGDSDAGVLRVSRFFAEEHHLASGDRVQLKPLAKQALTLNRAVLVARTQSAYRFATKKGTCYCFHTRHTHAIKTPLLVLTKSTKQNNREALAQPAVGSWCRVARGRARFRVAGAERDLAGGQERSQGERKEGQG
jgi:hypothetical protein